MCDCFQGWWWSVLTCTVLYSAMLCGAVCPAGIKEVGGATIVYRTRHLRDASSWRYDGLLCTGDGQTGVHLCVCVCQPGSVSKPLLVRPSCAVYSVSCRRQSSSHVLCFV